MHAARLLHASDTLPFAKGHIVLWLICAGYDRHRPRVNNSVYNDKTCICKSDLRECDLWTSESLDAPRIDPVSVITWY